MVIVVPIYEEAMPGVYYNTAAVIDADGAYLGKTRKTAYPAGRRLLGEVLLQPGSTEYPVYKTATASSASISATTGISPKAGAPWPSTAPNTSSILGDGRRTFRASLEAGAAGLGGRRMAAISARSTASAEAPWNIGEFYGQSYFVNPRGVRSRRSPAATRTSCIVHDMDTGTPVREVRNTWQFSAIADRDWLSFDQGE